jgi:hypothetical protein
MHLIENWSRSLEFVLVIYRRVGRDSVVGIATHYGLRGGGGGGSGDRIPAGARLSAAVQTSPGAYPASCTMGTGSFPWVKRPGRGVDHIPPSSTEDEERADLYLYPPLGLHDRL